MHLVYCDESGNSGTNLSDSEQPIFVLGALIVPESCWQAVESDLEKALETHFPELAKEGIEIHGGDLRGSRGHFKNVPTEKRIALRDSWLTVAINHELRFTYRAIVKKAFQKWLDDAFGPNAVVINPHVAAFALTSMVVNDYLANANALGMFISDENKEIVRNVEKSIRALRLSDGPIRLSHIIEKGFFIDSHKSRLLQLCDLCTLHARKKEEAEHLGKTKPFDEAGIKLVESLVHRGDEKWRDVLAWLAEVHNRKGWE